MNRFLNKLVLVTLGTTLTFGIVDKPARASLIGDTVDCFVTPGGLIPVEPNFRDKCIPTSAVVVDPGDEFFVDFFGLDVGLNVDLKASSISIASSEPSALLVLLGKLTLSDLDWVDAPGRIVGFSLNTVPFGLTESDISFDAHSITDEDIR